LAAPSARGAPGHAESSGNAESSGPSYSAALKTKPVKKVSGLELSNLHDTGDRLLNS